MVKISIFLITIVKTYVMMPVNIEICEKSWEERFLMHPNYIHSMANLWCSRGNEIWWSVVQAVKLLFDSASQVRLDSDPVRPKWSSGYLNVSHFERHPEQIEPSQGSGVQDGRGHVFKCSSNFFLWHIGYSVRPSTGIYITYIKYSASSSPCATCRICVFKVHLIEVMNIDVRNMLLFWAKNSYKFALCYNMFLC